MDAFSLTGRVGFVISFPIPEQKLLRNNNLAFFALAQKDERETPGMCASCKKSRLK